VAEAVTGAADTEVADTEAVTLVEATSAAATSAVGTSPEAGAMCMSAVPTCTSAGPMFTSPEAAASGMIAAVGLAVMAVGVLAVGDMAAGVMADPMAPATRTAGCIRPATGRSELKQMGVLNAHLASHESSRLFTPVPGGWWLRDLHRVARPSQTGRKRHLVSLHQNAEGQTALNLVGGVVVLETLDGVQGTGCTSMDQRS
jgi:hypothetical protein